MDKRLFIGPGIFQRLGERELEMQTIVVAQVRSPFGVVALEDDTALARIASETLAATGVYQPEVTRAPANQGTLDYDPNATGAFVEKNTGVPGAPDPSAATGDFTTPQAGATIDPAPARRAPAVRSRGDGRAPVRARR